MNDFYVVIFFILLREIVCLDYVLYVNFVVGRKLFMYLMDKIVCLLILNNEGMKERNDFYGYLDNFSNCVCL